MSRYRIVKTANGLYYAQVETRQTHFWVTLNLAEYRWFSGGYPDGGFPTLQGARKALASYKAEQARVAAKHTVVEVFDDN